MKVGRLVDGWKRFWFAHGSARNLGAARIVFATQGLWILLSRDFAALSSLPEPYWTYTEAVWRWRYLIFPGHPGFEMIVQGTAILALAAALVGWLARPACFLGGVLLYHLAPLEALIWTPTPVIRGLTITVVGLIILSLSRCEDSLAVTAHRSGRAPVEPSLDYSWQLRLIQLLLCQVYLFSAYSKLMTSGLDWVASENLRNWLLYFGQVPELAVFSAPGAWLAGQPALNLALAAGTIVFEAGFIVVMFSDMARRVLLPVAFLFHVGILVTMNLTFPALLLLFVFVNWETVLAGRRSRTGQPGGIAGPALDAPAN